MKTADHGAVRMDKRKLRELILHIAVMSEGDAAFGMVKLNKLLFFADFLAYQRFGAAITGARYQALPQGPAPRAMMPMLKDMVRKAELAIGENPFYGRNQQRALALRQPKLDRFEAREIALVDQLVGAHWGKTAREVSDASHQFLGWRLAESGEVIPYGAVLLGSRDLSAAEIERAKSLQPLAAECLNK